MNKKTKIIKRVYEKGREETIFRAKKLNFANRQTPKSSAAPKQRLSPVKKQVVLPGQRFPEQHASKRVIVDNYELPSYYGTTRLTLMAKDPLWVYAYWEIAQDSLISLKSNLPAQEAENAKLILRMYDVTLIDFNGYNANRYFDIEVGHNANNWYIKLWNDSVSYIGDIGLRVADGRFFTLVRSNCVHTPRINYSSRTDQIWMKVTDKVATPPYVVSQIRVPQTQTNLPSHTATAGKKTIYLREEDIRRYYSGLSPLLRDIISSRISRLYGSKTGMHSFILEGETDEERNRALLLLPEDYFVKRVSLGSSQELIIIGGKKKRPGGASEFMQASEFVQEKAAGRKFFFEIAAELIVYGRTEPNAQVWLAGKQIQLREDGTFSLRFGLPDGKLPLEFKAVSHDKKENKKINTYVERRTPSCDRGKDNA